MLQSYVTFIMWRLRCMMKKVILLLVLMVVIVSFLSGCNEQKSGEVNNKPAILEISAEPLTGYQPLEVTFTSLGNDSDGEIVSYQWDFDDGGTSNLQNSVHTFQNPGIFNVQLTIIDNDGAICKESITITIEENKPPIASVLASTYEGTIPLSVSFQDFSKDDDGSIVSYKWNFDDGTSSEEINPVHIFDNYGTYEVILTITDNSGNKDSCTTSITAKIPIVTDQDLALITWIGEKIDELGPLCSTVHRAVSSLSTYIMDDKGWELNELAEQYQEDINQFTDLSEHFVTIKNKFSTVLENYESIGSSAWVIAYDLDRGNYNIAEIGIESFAGELEDLTDSLNKVTDLISYIE